MRVPGERTTSPSRSAESPASRFRRALLADLGRVADKLGVPHLSA